MNLTVKKLTCVLVLLAALRPGLVSASPIALEAVGDRSFHIVSPTVLELGCVTSKEPDPAPVTDWNFVGPNFTPVIPTVASFAVEIDGQPVPVSAVGFKRRPIYAPLRTRDLRIGNHLYLTLAQPISEGQTVTVKNPAGDLWNSPSPYFATMDPARHSPAIHVNQVGYAPGETKKGMVGYYLGSLGELPITGSAFQVIDTATGSAVYDGVLRSRKDVGYTYSPAPYQSVYEADFTALQTPGNYRLQVPGLGTSFPFQIGAGVPAVFARAYALGLYHQRCGAANTLPHTRHEHGICHAAPAAIPDMSFATLNYQLSAMSYDFNTNPRHTARQLNSVEASLYPFVNSGTVNVSGGHHDAGDYSKYTINSAGLIHHLVFAADSLGAGDLDNLGLPESGDGISDLLQEAKWEADFLAKMQDADGGFYFLVYPRARAYEDDVLPDKGDAQSVFPKTTAATAAASAALAEIASSPRFKQAYPAESALYLSKAQLGWEFLLRAIATHGKDGAYQKITHYGNEFMHDDELAWAAAALFAATGDAVYHAKLLEFFPNPNDKTTRRWDWWRLFEGYGCAVRTYAFAARSGRLAPEKLDASYLAKCDTELLAAGDDIARFAEQTSYGTSFPDPSKAYRSAGWYFSSERAFELAAAFQLNASARYLDAIASNVAYEAGCNPLNMSYITGLGYRRWREIVHQYALNDTRVLPPSGLPLGNIQGGMPYLENYKKELGALCFPPDGASTAPYPFYDRFADTFNTTTEFVVVDQARGLGLMAFALARTGDSSSPSQNLMGTITGLPQTVPAGTAVQATLQANLDLSGAVIVWEAKDQEPFIGPVFEFAPKNSGEQWVEVEAQLRDGRRVFGKTSFTASFALNIPPNSFQSAPVSLSAETAGLYHLDHNLADAAGKQPALSLFGHARLDSMNLGWMQHRSGTALRFDDLGDKATVNIPASLLYTSGLTHEITLEAMVYVHAYKAWNRGAAKIVSLERGWNSSLQFKEEMYGGPHLRGGTQFDFFGTALEAAMPIRQWHHLSLSISTAGYSARINGVQVASAASSELAGWNGGHAVLELGNFEGWVDEVVIRSRALAGPDTPSNFEVIDISNDSVTLRWNDTSNETGYRIYRSLNDLDYSEIATLPLNATSWTNGGLKIGTTYWYALKAFNALGESAPALASISKSATKAPAAPLRFVAKGALSSIRLSWLAMSATTEYALFRSLNPSGPYLKLWEGSATSTEDLSAEAGKTYFYFVRGSNPAGPGPNSILISGRTLTLPSAPSRLTAKGLSEGISVQWVAGLNTDYFKVCRSASKEGPFATVAAKITQNTFIDTTAPLGETCYYQVIAVNSVGETPSTLVSATRN